MEYDRYCSQPPGGDWDALALLLMSSHVVHLYVHSMVSIQLDTKGCWWMRDIFCHVIKTLHIVKNYNVSLRINLITKTYWISSKPKTVSVPCVCCQEALETRLFSSFLSYLLRRSTDLHSDVPCGISHANHHHPLSSQGLCIFIVATVKTPASKGLISWRETDGAVAEEDIKVCSFQEQDDSTLIPQCAW